MLFLKRVNDRFEEETEEIADEHGIPEEMVESDRDLHEEFWVPERARWDHITAQESDIGAALNKALEAIENENDEIADRVLSSIDYNDKDRLGDQVLDKLVTHFSKYRYRNEDLDDPDIFGRAYEYLIRQFADDAGKKGGEFLFYWIRYNEDRLRILAEGTRQLGLSVSDIASFPLPFPPIQEQREIAETLQAVETKLADEHKLKEEIQQLKRGLMQDLLTGEVRTPESLGG